MNTLYIVLPMLFLISACSSNQKNSYSDDLEKRRQDSILIADSIKADEIRIKSLEHIAWGDTKFGMTVDDVKKSNAFSKGQLWKGVFSVSNDSTQIGGREFRSIYAKFYNDKLYRIEIYSKPRELEPFEDFLKDIEALRGTICVKYGKPKFVENNTNYISSQLMEKQNAELFRWEIGRKNIAIYIIHEFNEYYSVWCLINDSDLTFEKIKEDKLKEKECNVQGF